MAKEKEKGSSAGILESLASMKLTLFIFFALAAASVIGTLLPQGAELHEMEGSFSPGMISFIETLGLNNLYHSSWFRMLLMLLCVNLLVCTVDRLPKTIKLIRRQEDQFDSGKLSKYGTSALMVTKVSPREAQPLLQSAVSETFGSLRDLGSSGRYCGVIEKGRWSRLVVYGVHASVLLVVLGALLGSIVGFKGSMNIPEGEASSEVELTAGAHNHFTLPFQIKCEKFQVSFYDTGAPKEFKSDLAVIDNGKEMLKQSIVVNDPMTYDGVTFYQASYGSMLKQAELELKDRTSGKSETINLPLNEVLPIPGTDDQIRISDFQDNLMGFGPALGIVIGKQGKQPNGSWVLAEKPDFHGNRIQNYQIRVRNLSKINYTGLQVKRDPGVWVVYLGFTLMLLGIGLTFYSSHNKVWACIETDEKNKRTVVAVAGRTSRNPQGFNEKFDELRGRLNDVLKPEPIKPEQLKPEKPKVEKTTSEKSKQEKTKPGKIKEDKKKK